jgi:hypothetical protein
MKKAVGAVFLEFDIHYKNKTLISILPNKMKINKQG